MGTLACVEMGYSYTVKVGCTGTPMLLCYTQKKDTHTCNGVAETPLGVYIVLIQFRKLLNICEHP